MAQDHSGILSPITITSLGEEVYRRLKQAIVDGDLAPGERLVESTLAGSLNVSRTPVREALRRLTSEGLVAADGSRGLIVARTSVENVAYAYDLREVLEGYAARLAAQHHRPDLFAILAESLFSMERGFSDAAQLDHHHSRFHDTIAAMAENPFLVHALANLERFRTRMVTLDWITKARVAASIPEHRRIFEAIERRSPDEAEERARAHVRATREGLLQRLKGK